MSVLISWDIVTKLMNCFPNSVINHNAEFIAHIKSNTYFGLKDCENETDVKCKVLEWLSRPAYKTEPYNTKRSNDEFHRFMLGGINQFWKQTLPRKIWNRFIHILGIGATMPKH